MHITTYFIYTHMPRDDPTLCYIVAQHQIMTAYPKMHCHSFKHTENAKIS